jgi:RNA-directed DNA polymerase
MESVERFLSKKLRLAVNRNKSAVAKPHERSFLGFSFTSGRHLRIKLSEKALRRMKHRIKQITRRSRGVALAQVIKELNIFLRGWLNYYRLIETKTILRDIDSWIRRRLRCFMMKQWINNCHTRFNALCALGVNEYYARPVAASRKGPWVLSHIRPVRAAMPNRFFAEKGLLCLLHLYVSLLKAT